MERAVEATDYGRASPPRDKITFHPIKDVTQSGR
jgi:hypothetical protein